MKPVNRVDVEWSARLVARFQASMIFGYLTKAIDNKKKRLSGI